LVSLFCDPKANLSKRGDNPLDPNKNKVIVLFAPLYPNKVVVFFFCFVGQQITTNKQLVSIGPTKNVFMTIDPKITQHNII
jgi:hypothetical protein